MLRVVFDSSECRRAQGAHLLHFAAAFMEYEKEVCRLERKQGGLKRGFDFSCFF
jgi:hypothetical protein